MKISKERLVQIIKEEVEKSQEPQGNVKALGQFSAKLLQLSKAQFPIDVSEFRI